ncbi:DNA repair protein xrcc1 [Clonorchis sinensis]|uniref:DNA repair protein xrcc1 n=1 Tax=Clonorchis sinensis TaxID=79923 RepID=A0A8T1MAP5_CLOSI|nr:DNA repair protein xrcc1 [Clonorchis sinensis]
MPEIRPFKVVSFSSEDKAFPASNLLKTSSFSKWRSEKGGTKQEVVELNFEEPVEVCRLDIGNNGSAFIEVLVRRSASADDPSVLLPSSSFLSPVEAKNESNLNRVRVFSGDQLTNSVASQKWDVFRFVCSQPFNKNLQYGISFVSFHSPALRSQQPETTLNRKTLISDTMIDVGDDEEPGLRPGALFQAAKAAASSSLTAPTNSVAQPVSVAEKLLAAKHSRRSEILSASRSPASTHITAPPDRPRLSAKHSLTSANLPSSSSARSTTNQAVNPSTHNPASHHSSGANSKQQSPGASVSSTMSQSPPSLRRGGSHPTSSRPLHGVVFCLSGYQNPLRSELREKALDLGASFRQDWGPNCTHLICAFANTPKFKEVKGKGIIVSDKWIQECHMKKAKVNWRPYRVGRAPSPPNIADDAVATAPDEGTDESPSSSQRPSSARKSLKRKAKSDDDEDWRPTSEELSEEEDEEEGEEDNASADEGGFEPDGESDEEDNDHSERRKTKHRGTKKKQKATRHPCHSTDSVGTSKRSKTTDKPDTSGQKNTPGATEWTPVRRKGPSAGHSQSAPVDPDEENTDDEIQRALNSPAKDAGADQACDDAAPAEVAPIELPDIFEGKHFFLHPKDIPVDEERLLQRLIIAFAGNLHPYMHPDVQYVITRSAWSEEFDNALSDNSSLIFVRPDWIFACDHQGKWVPFQKFLVVG